MSEKHEKVGTVGTHQGSLDADARQRRAIKKAHYLQNVETRREQNRNRGNRS